MHQPIHIEPAHREDSRFIAEMIAISSDGIAILEWREQIGGDSDLEPLDIGAQNYAADDGDYSYRNCLLARNDDGRPAGMILAFALTEANRSTDAKPPPYADDDFYAPYKYLEAVPSWYICGVAVIPEFRGRGIARQLIEATAEIGKKTGYDNVSLIAMRTKTRLIAYYESLGFQITRVAPIVEHPLIDARGEAVLMETRPA